MSTKRELAGLALGLAIFMCTSPEGQGFIKRTFSGGPVEPGTAPQPDDTIAAANALATDATVPAGQGSISAIPPQVATALPYSGTTESYPRAATTADNIPRTDYRATLQSGVSSAMQPVMPGPASREFGPPLSYTSPLVGAPRSSNLDFGSGTVLNRAGPGTYSSANGDIYTQAGPNGVLNTRTGEFSPAN